MKKTILTASCLVLCVMGLMAQSKKADTANKPKAESYTFTHQDSVLIQKLMIDAQFQQEHDNFVPSAPHLPGTGINDVIDVEHEIK